jgi:16S rRNA (guanine527-N7)-methyltransferase
VRLEQFFRLLLVWNARINLTGAQSMAALAAEHLPDALALDRLVPPRARLVDVGTGGGLPALPFALLRPDVALTLVEPRAKRVAFLRTALRELEVSATIQAGRIEERPGAERGTFDVSASRATFPPEEWLPIGRGLVRAGGLVVLFLSTPVPPELGPDVVDSVAYQAGEKARVAVAIRA